MGGMGMDAMQTEAAIEGRLTAYDVVQVAAQAQASSRGAGAGGGTGAGAAVSAPGVPAGASERQEWTSLVTLSHTEDRIAVAVISQSRPEIEFWLGQWVGFCARAGMQHKVRWAVNRLLANAAATRAQNPTQIPTPNPNPTTEFSFLDTCPDPIALVRGVVIPAVGRCGVSAGGLLGDIEDACEFALG